VPWGQDRLVPIFLATLGMRQQKKTITFRSAAEMLDIFGMQQSGSQYRRLIAAFQRVCGVTIFFGTDTQREKAMVTHQARFNFMREARIWYSRNPNQELLPGGFENEIVLSDEFFGGVATHSIPTDLEAAKAVPCAPAALDLFMWLSLPVLYGQGTVAYSALWRFWTRGSARQRGLCQAAQISRAVGVLVGSRSSLVAELSGTDRIRRRLHAHTTCHGAGRERT
jgi:hypothetical protein